MFGEMNGFAYTVWLAGQAADGLTMLWPVTFLLPVLAGGAVLWDVWGARLKFGRRMLYLLLPVIGVVTILLMGSLFENHPGLVCLPYVGVGTALVLAIVSTVVLRPAWMSSITVSLCLLWYSVWCGFVSLMSITGDWL